MTPEQATLITQLQSTLEAQNAALALAQSDVLRLEQANTDYLRDQDFVRSKLALMRPAMESAGFTWPEGLWS